MYTTTLHFHNQFSSEDVCGCLCQLLPAGSQSAIHLILPAGEGDISGVTAGEGDISRVTI